MLMVSVSAAAGAAPSAVKSTSIADPIPGAGRRIRPVHLARTAARRGGRVVLAVGITAAYATYQDWTTVVPFWAMAGGVGATLVIGGLAGFYPPCGPPGCRPPRRSGLPENPGGRGRDVPDVREKLG
jgi:hypothetical protein